jgi:dTDP-glucose pyrophosphorylase
MKAVILARGLGTRMRAADDRAALGADEARVADTGVKSLVPLEGRPFLDYILSSLADAGCTEICLVIGPEHDAIRERYTTVVPPRRFRIAFAVQEKPLGTGNAVLAAESFVDGDEFLMANSDNYYPVEVLRTLVTMGRPGTVFFTPEGLAAHSNIEPERVLAFALGRLGADGCLDELVEKPDAKALAAIGSERLVSMNCWRFPAVIFDACRKLVPSARGELELTDAIMQTIARGVRLLVLRSELGVLDLSKRGDIKAVKEGLRGVKVDL